MPEPMRGTFLDHENPGAGAGRGGREVVSALLRFRCGVGVLRNGQDDCRSIGMRLKPVFWPRLRYILAGRWLWFWLWL
jgi:hypothetical protein